MSDSDRLDFNAAASELGVTPDELERLVAAGEIASVKEGDELFFSRAALSAYQDRQGGGEPEIILSDDEINLLEDDDIDFGIDLESPEEPAAVGKPAEISLGDDLDLGGDDLLSIGADSDSGSGDETVLSLDGVLDDSESTTPLPGDGLLEDDGLLDTGGMGDETLLDTDILDLGDDDADTFELDTTEDTLLDPTEEGTLLRGGGARVMQMKRKKSHAAWTALLTVSTVVLFLPFAVLLSVIYGGDGGGARNEWIAKYGGALKGAVDGVADLLR